MVRKRILLSSTQKYVGVAKCCVPRHLYDAKFACCIQAASETMAMVTAKPRRTALVFLGEAGHYLWHPIRRYSTSRRATMLRASKPESMVEFCFSY
eukprot:6186885-Pleurochrysis_carterae.AAC.1